LLTDRAPEFESDLFNQLMKWLDVDKLRTTAYKPSTNGVAERFHRTLNSMLGKVVSESQRDWDERLPLVMAAYRASPHSSTGFSPNRLFLGRENRMPLDLVMGLPPEEKDDGESIDAFVLRQQELADAAYELAREQLQVAAERRKVAYDVRVKKQQHHVGDWVWYYYPRRYTGRSQKWQRSYIGPFLIVREIPPVNFVLQRSQRSKPFVVHGDKIKRCYSTTPVSWIPTVYNGDVQPSGTAVDPVHEDGGDVPRSVHQSRDRRLSPVVDTSDPVVEENPDDGQSRPVRNRKTPAYLRYYACQ
jgi:hypothetical protein